MSSPTAPPDDAPTSCRQHGGAAPVDPRARSARRGSRWADHRALLAVLRQVGAEGCYWYAHDPLVPSAAHARFFNPTVGLWEDAATGTAAGPLAGYLGHAGLLHGTRLTVEQGVKVGRRS